MAYDPSDDIVRALLALAQAAAGGTGTMVLIPHNSERPVLVFVDGSEMLDATGQHFQPLKTREFLSRATDLRLADRNAKQVTKALPKGESDVK